MKLKSVILVLTGVVIGGLLFATPKNTKHRKELLKKSRKYQKAFKATANKYKEKLAEQQ